MKKSSLIVVGVVVGIVIGVVIIRIPFQVLAEREGPIDSVTEVITAALMFVIFIPFGVFTLWVVAGAVAAELLASFWWGHLKEGMRKEDVLHILGEPTWKSEGTNIVGARETTWGYRYQWFALRGWIEFDQNDTVIWIRLPRGKPEERYRGEFHGW